MMPPSLRLEGDDLNAHLIEYFTCVYEKYEDLFTLLSCDEAYYKKPIELRHPLIFYFGHTATFFINKMVIAGIAQRIDPYIESICAVGVDEMSWDDLNDANYSWPSVQRVQEYRQKVKLSVIETIKNYPTQRITWEHPLWSVVMGIEHELIHLETSSVLIRQHEMKYICYQPHWASNVQNDHDVTSTLVMIEAGDITYNKKHDEPWYGWDNEYGHHHDHINEFMAESMIVSNGDFLHFVRDGGYEKHHYWSDEGWKWRNFAHASHPTFWIKRGEDFDLRLLCEITPLYRSLPVETNFHEAQAYCAWKREKTGLPYRLPTEDEWRRMVDVSTFNDQCNEKPTLCCDHLRFNSSCAVDTFLHGQLYDVMGNVWQWTQTPIYPFDGFKTHPYYDDFTAPTFDGRHNIIAGSSWISCGNEALISSRYAFRRHFFQHAGFRPVVSSYPPKIEHIHYENDPLLTRIVHSNFAIEANCAYHRAIIDDIMCTPTSKVLFIGCESGVLPFLLSPQCAHIDAVEPSARLLDLAVELQEGQTLHYTLPDEGELVSYHDIKLDDDSRKHCSKISFIQADPSNLKPMLTGYDIIVVHAILERIYDPSLLLKTISSRLKKKGRVVIVSSSYSLYTHTQPHENLGGYKKDGETYTTLQAINDHLSFEFEHTTPFKKISRSIYQNSDLSHTVTSHISSWVKK